jgi:hypothetical protein
MSGEQESESDPRDETIRQQAETIRQQADRLKQLEDQVKRLEALLASKADTKAAKKPVFNENYSLDRNMARPIKNVALGLFEIMTEAINLGYERRNAFYVGNSSARSRCCIGRNDEIRCCWGVWC